MPNPNTYEEGLKVSYASLDAAADAIDKQAKNLKGDLDEIEREVREISAVWEGEAKTAYQATMKKWEAEVSAVHLNLMQIAQAVRLSKDGYQATDMKSAKWFQDQGRI
ncbi:WXG100 family type VII secretion target [Streptomyces sp. CA-250714]|uniref:WXG100 family type VII secretion target n=1 Tax=Streptomyces sp. CA-250714 TaxID=3240060 RepID=UPI003D8D670E